MATADKRDKIAEFSLAQAKKYKNSAEPGRSFPHFLGSPQIKAFCVNVILRTW
mgnify:CR=1